ncbi:N-acetyltransferase [Catellatospora sp. TT07R-123]|uniref:GNAT family N-acetyltransferase n=1 Tax=Catellatospora sp. TT07R-123 TaxID=2733863 RepID=UPI001B119379|nr:GNAT family N-acetyltransferase [Catellatospora sp. TT07R-123]GHJ50130.1 N-acetyltransferase [Catellatospora sp. TT07R-123]
MTAGIVVRSAVPADLDEIGELSVAAYRGDGQTREGHPYEAHLLDAGARADLGALLVAADAATGRVLGAVTFVLAGTPLAEVSKAGEAEFRMLAVTPSAQGRGVGEALVRACLDRAAEAGCATVVICVRDFARDAQRLYERLGFERFPERDWSPLPGVTLLGLRYPL